MITEKKLELLHRHLVRIPHRLIRKALDPIIRLYRNVPILVILMVTNWTVF